MPQVLTYMLQVKMLQAAIARTMEQNHDNHYLSLRQRRIPAMSEVQRREELSKGIWQTLYGFPMVVSICFRLNSNGAAQLRDAIIKRLYGAKEKTNIVLQLYGGTNSFS